tara:strand:+ start:61 stop:1353 length:1293 start_codon:yes stop_codon:yes gene_type:complete
MPLYTNVLKSIEREKEEPGANLKRAKEIGLGALNFVGIDPNSDSLLQDVSMEIVEMASHAKSGQAALVTYPVSQAIQNSPMVRRGLQQLDEIVEPVKTFLTKDHFEPIYESIGVQPNRGLLSQSSSDVFQGKPLQIKSSTTAATSIAKRTPTTELIKSQLKDLDPRLAKREVAKLYADQPEFLKELSELNRGVQQWYDSAGKGRLKGYKGPRTITAPDGRVYRVRDANAVGQTGVFQISQDISARNTAQIRKIAQQPDLITLRKQFQKYVPKNKVDSTLKFYNQTNKKVYNALTAARKRYNIGKPKADHATIEHIFDVDFYKRLKAEEVPGFSGSGADELWNLKMITYALNTRTGALNKKAKDMGKVLIDAVRKDEFIDYNKVVKDFVENDLGSKINKLTPKDWDIITDYSMKNPKLNMQQILINYTKGK